MEAGFKVGDIVDAEVSRITDFGAFVKINGGKSGLIHISQIAEEFVKDVQRHLKVGERVKARIVRLGPGKKIDLSMKRPRPVSPGPERAKQAPNHFSRYKQDGQARQRLRYGGQARLRQGYGGQAGFKSSDFEDKLKQFLQTS